MNQEDQSNSDEATPPIDPTSSSPEVFALRRSGSHWQPTRRDVVALGSLAGAVGTAALSGCGDPAGRPSTTTASGTGAAGTLPLAHTDTITQLLAIPGGDLVVTASRDKTVKVWDVPAGTLRRSLLDHDSAVVAVAVSPDGRTLVSRTEKGTLKFWTLPEGEAKGARPIVWDAADGAGGPFRSSPDRGMSPPENASPTPPIDGKSPVHAMMFSSQSDQLYVLVGGKVGAVTVATVSGRTLFVAPPTDTHHFVRGSRADYLMSISPDQTLLVRTLPSGEEVARGRVPKGLVLPPALSPSEDYLAVATSERQLEVLHFPDVSGVVATTNLETAPRRLEFRDASRIDVIDTAHRLTTWQLQATWKFQRAIDAHADSILRIDASADGKTLVSAGRDSTLRMWNTAQWTPLQRIGFSSPIFSVLVSPHGTYVASGLKAGEVSINQISNAASRYSVATSGASVVGLEFDSDERTMWTCDRDATIQTLEWNNSTGRFNVSGAPHRLGGVASSFAVVARRDARFAVGMVDGSIQLVGGAKEPEVLAGHTGKVYALHIAPPAATNGSEPPASAASVLLSASGDGTVRRWNLNDSARVKTMSGHTQAVYGVTSNRERGLAISCGHDAQIVIWSLEGGRMLETLDAQVAALDVRMLPSGHIVCGGVDGKLRVWDPPGITASEAVVLKDGDTPDSPDGYAWAVVEKHRVIVVSSNKRAVVVSRATGLAQSRLSDVAANPRPAVPTPVTSSTEATYFNGSSAASPRTGGSYSGSSYSGSSYSGGRYSSGGHYWRPN